MRSDWLSEKDLEFLKLLKKAGCIQTEFGFESGSPRILSFLKKNTTTVEGNSKAIKLCKKAGLRVFGNFMIGTVGETLEDLKMTKDFILKRNKDLNSLGIFITTPHPGTELWEICKKKGLLENLKWDDLKMDALKSPRTFSDTLSQEEILKTYKEFTSLSVERYSLSFKIKKFFTNPRRYFSLLVPYISYKIKKR